MDLELTRSVLVKLLEIDLKFNASKFKFIEQYSYELSKDFVMECIDVLDQLSHEDTEKSNRLLIGIAALLWTYSSKQWYGLDNYLILFLTRNGFGPTASMLDSTYRDNNSYNGSYSLMNQFAIAVDQLRYEIIVGDQRFLITKFQKEVWDAIDKQKLTGISAPTSAGKSYVILLKTIDTLLKTPGNVIYIVPTLSLVAQVARDFREALKVFQLSFEVETTYSQQRASEKKIYVLTQEKAISAFSQSDVPFHKVKVLIVDEIQNIERAVDGSEQRAKILFDLMIEINRVVPIEKLIISGPRVTNIDELGKDIFGINGYKVATKSSPVMNLTYSIKNSDKGYIFKLYCDLLKQPLSIKISNSQKIEGYGKSIYGDKYLGFLTDFIDSFDAEETNIIFTPTTPAARKVAVELRSAFDNANSDYLSRLSDYLINTVHEKFSLSDTVLSGIAYHHGKLPHHVRAAIEDGIRNRHIKNVVCTTTLLQGVNLPVQNIIIRNPNLYVKSKKGERPQLTNYETANLRGRAGRLLKDFVGRTYIMDEDSFSPENEQQKSLFENVEKTIKVGYGTRYIEHEAAIMEDIIANKGQADVNKEYSYLVTYIRQSVLKHGLDAVTILKNVGINIESEQIGVIQAQLDTLTVPKEVCFNNRYWDPIDLNRLYNSINKIVLPNSISERQIAFKIKDVLLFLKNEFNVYYERYCHIEETKYDYLYSFSILAERWLREQSLKVILSNKFYDSNDRIEDAISTLQNKVSFGLPMLMKPLYDIQYPNSSFLRFIELGAYRPSVRRLIELNIPRETAIYLAGSFDLGNINDVSELKSRLREISSGLDYFDSLQLTSI